MLPHKMKATYFKAKVYDDPSKHWDRVVKTDESYVTLWNLFNAYDDHLKIKKNDVNEIAPKMIGVRLYSFFLL